MQVRRWTGTSSVCVGMCACVHVCVRVSYSPQCVPVAV